MPCCPIGSKIARCNIRWTCSAIPMRSTMCSIKCLIILKESCTITTYPSYPPEVPTDDPVMTLSREFLSRRLARERIDCPNCRKNLTLATLSWSHKCKVSADLNSRPNSPRCTSGLIGASTTAISPHQPPGQYHQTTDRRLICPSLREQVDQIDSPLYPKRHRTSSG